MEGKYSVVNIREPMENSKVIFDDERPLSDMLSEFSCPKNPDVEAFLRNSAIDFTKKASR